MASPFQKNILTFHLKEGNPDVPFKKRQSGRLISKKQSGRPISKKQSEHPISKKAIQMFHLKKKAIRTSCLNKKRQSGTSCFKKKKGQSGCPVSKKRGTIQMSRFQKGGNPDARWGDPDAPFPKKGVIRTSHFPKWAIQTSHFQKRGNPDVPFRKKKERR